MTTKQKIAAGVCALALAIPAFYFYMAVLHNYIAGIVVDTIKHLMGQ